MALYGYTIGEDRDQDPTNGKQLDVYRFLIPSASTTKPKKVTPTLVGTINLPGTATTADLEGLGTNPDTGRIGAVNEARVTGSTTPIDPTVNWVNNIDQPFAPVTVSPKRTPSSLRRFGFESGADFGEDYSKSGKQTVLYNISGNKSTTNGVPVGSSLYKITPGKPGTISLVDSFGAPTTSAEKNGTQPTNAGKYADGLAIDNLNPGRTRALASDFSTSDGDGSQLYKVDLLTGELSAPINIIDQSTKKPLNVNADSGLAFSNVIGSPQRLFAWLETGSLYEIVGFQDELSASGLSLGSATGTNGAGLATARLIATVNLPNAITGFVDYEGFTIANE